jgi:PelA/Pel-15E family pectate lyase
MIRCLSLILAALLPAAVAPAAVQWNDILRQPAVWYAGAEARAIAANVALYQAPSGGWPKAVDMTVPPGEKFAALSVNARAPTIDNDGTTTQVRFLALVVTATSDATVRATFERGFDYLLAAQYDNGGWPQFFPLREGYYTHITYNDNATANVLAILRETTQGQAPFAFVDADRRVKAAAAVEQAVACILRTQVKQDGKVTVWCAQHDEKSFAPAWARNFEPPSLSGSESVGLVKFLMGVKNPSPEIIAAIEGAVAWFGAVQIRGLRVDNTMGADGTRDRRAMPDPAARSLWARFYELETDKPIFLGRDKVVHYDFNEIEWERRTGYIYLSDWPASLLEKDYPRWKAKNKLP